MMFETKPITKFSIVEKGTGNKLEEVVKEDFGEQGLKKFGDYDIRIDAPINSQKPISFSIIGSISDLGKWFPNNHCGKVYEIETTDIKTIRTKGNVNTTILINEREIKSLMDLDLNSENPEKRYLRLLFRYYR